MHSLSIINVLFGDNKYHARFKLRENNIFAIYKIVQIFVSRLRSYTLIMQRANLIIFVLFFFYHNRILFDKASRPKR